MEKVVIKEVEKVVEVAVEHTTTKQVEVEKIVEIIKEVEKIVYKTAEGGGGEESECGCLTGDRFLTVWNNLFKLTGTGSNACITEEQFVGLITKSLARNSANLGSSDTNSMMDTQSSMSMK